MDLGIIEGRGITSGNEVYFIFNRETDKVVVATYRDMPGVPLDRREPNLIKTFSKDEWTEINRFLSAGADDYEDEFEDEPDGKLPKYEDEEERPDISPEGNLPRVAPGLPSMSKDEIQEKFDPITGTSNEEKKEDGKINSDGGEETSKTPGSAPQGSERVSEED